MLLTSYKSIFEKIISMSTDGFIVVDNEGLVIHINQQYADFFEMSKEEIIGRSILEIIRIQK